MKKHIRVVTPWVAQAGHDVGHLQYLERHDLQISVVGIDEGPTSVESRFGSALAVPPTCAKIIEAEREGVHAVVVGCLGDIGVYEARECVSIPVLGPFETCVHMVSMLAHKYSVVTLVDDVIPLMESYVIKYGATDKLASIRSIQMSAQEMEVDPDRRNARLVMRSLEVIKQDGAAAIILGCSAMLGAAEFVRRALILKGINVPVVDPIPLTILAAATLVDAGLSHSKSTFPSRGDINMREHGFPKGTRALSSRPALPGSGN